jgi:hypothetical protein
VAEYVNISFWALSDNRPGIEYKFGDWSNEPWFSYQHRFERKLEQLRNSNKSRGDLKEH